MRGVPKAETREPVRDGAELLGIDELLERKPRELSGGQRQRVAMGRAIVRQPAGVPDGRAAVEPRREAQGADAGGDRRLHRRLGVTTIYVTHDQTEAMTLGDRVVVLKEGVVQQVDTPQGLYQLPGEHVRGELHRQPADELHPRPPRRTARRSGPYRFALPDEVARR